MAGWLWPAGCGPGLGSGQGFVEPVEHPGAQQPLGAGLAVGAGALGVGKAGQGGPAMSCMVNGGPPVSDSAFRWLSWVSAVMQAAA